MNLKPLIQITLKVKSLMLDVVQEFSILMSRFVDEIMAVDYTEERVKF